MKALGKLSDNSSLEPWFCDSGGKKNVNLMASVNNVLTRHNLSMVTAMRSSVSCVVTVHVQHTCMCKCGECCPRLTINESVVPGLHMCIYMAR